LPDNPKTDPQDRSWFGPHDRLFVEEESEEIDFLAGPEEGIECLLCLSMFIFNWSKPLVWCWGWNGAGDLDGPDSEPVWEQMPESATKMDAVRVRHNRSFKMR